MLHPRWQSFGNSSTDDGDSWYDGQAIRFHRKKHALLIKKRKVTTIHFTYFSTQKRGGRSFFVRDHSTRFRFVPAPHSFSTSTSGRYSLAFQEDVAMLVFRSLLSCDLGRTQVVLFCLPFNGPGHKTSSNSKIFLGGQ
jgi:hypothetical protein